MTEVYAMTQGHLYWEAVMRFADRCSWKAGPHLAEEMRKNTFIDWERVFCAVVDGEIAGFCTFAEKDEISPAYGFTPFIGYVFVGEAYRGKRLSEKMIDAVMKYAKETGFQKVYIMSGEIGLYEKYGFAKLGEYPTIYGTADSLFVKTTEDFV